MGYEVGVKFSDFNLHYKIESAVEILLEIKEKMSGKIPDSYVEYIRDLGNFILKIVKNYPEIWETNNPLQPFDYHSNNEIVNEVLRSVDERWQENLRRKKEYPDLYK